MTEHEMNILKNTIEQMACDADDKGNDSFLIRLSVSDAFALSGLKFCKKSKWVYGKTKKEIVCESCGSKRPYEKCKRNYLIISNSKFCPNCGAMMLNAVSGE